MVENEYQMEQGDFGDPRMLIDDGSAGLWVVPNFGPDLYPDLSRLNLAVEPEIMIRGRLCHQRRDVGFYSDTSEGYRYSGQFAESIPFQRAPFLKALMDLVNASLGTNFNGCLVNRYRDGTKYLSAHSDSKIGLDKNNFMVVGICYGPGIRKFRIRDKNTQEIILDHPHQPRELLVMDGQFQDRYTHEIPIEKRVKGERISVTFRAHIK